MSKERKNVQVHLQLWQADKVEDSILVNFGDMDTERAEKIYQDIKQVIKANYPGYHQLMQRLKENK